jgi:hypothetical protein
METLLRDLEIERARSGRTVNLYEEIILPSRHAPFREFALSVGIDFSGALKVA